MLKLRNPEKNIQVAWGAYKDRGKKGIEEIES